VDSFSAEARFRDLYRWLENPASAETKAFVLAQNQITLPYLADLPERSELRACIRAATVGPDRNPDRARNG
jgi:prolyl oligopeptidase